MEQLKTNIQLEFSDFLRFQFWHMRLRIFTSFFMLFFLVALFAILHFLNIPYSIWDFSQLPLIILFVYYLILYFGIYYSSKKAFNNDHIIQKAQEYIFNSIGFGFSNSNGESRFAWEEMYRYDESKHNILIYTSPLKSIILPKRFFNEEQILFLRNTIQSKIKSKRKNVLLKGMAIRVGVILAIVGITFFVTFQKRSSADKYFQSGYEKLQMNNYEGAIKDYTMAIEEDNGNTTAYAYRGYAKGMLENYTGMLEDCSKAIALNTNNSVAYNYSAYAKRMLGDSLGACEDLEMAIALGNSEAEEMINEYCK